MPEQHAGGSRHIHKETISWTTNDSKRLTRTLGSVSSRRSTLKLLGGSAAGVFAAAGLRGASARPRRPETDPFSAVPVDGTVIEGAGGEFAGFLDIKPVRRRGRAAVRGWHGHRRGRRGGLVSTGGKLLIEGINSVDLSGGAAAARRVRAQATCEILTLNLGPLFLDLLGLVIELDEVNLVIRAEEGPGNLLGNLLCAVARLLDRGGLLDQLLQGLARLLNRILRIFQRL
jgi:hypothetical protein